MTEEISLESFDELSTEEANWDFVLPSESHRKLKKQLRNAIAAMSGRKKEVFVLILNGKTQDEIGTILGMSRSTVQTYYKRGVQQIKKIVEEK